MRNIPKKPKGKGKRWLKGHSCSSNPQTKKFRDAAKSRFFRHEVGNSSNLTVGALKTLDAFNSQKYGIKGSVKSEESGTQTSCAASTCDSWTSSKTFKTFASDWSNCTNASFSRLLNKFESKSFLHKEMLAVLAAVTEVIKSNGGKETSTEYFGALITTLKVTEDEETVAAILSLISMGIKSVPGEVLRLKFSEVSKVFLDLLAKYSELENPVILRAVIGCLSVILRAQDPGVWSYPSTQQTFHSILIFSTHSKPKVRKAGQHAVSAILKASSLFTSEETHPGAVTAAKYCIEHLESRSTIENTITLHILTLLKEIIGCFPKHYIKTICSQLLSLTIMGTAIVTSCSLEVLHNLFISAPPNHLDSTLNAQLINALYDCQPMVNDTQAVIAWLTVLQEGYKALARKDPFLCGENLEKFFSTATKLWLSEKTLVLQGATSCLRTVAIDCIQACGQSYRYSQICQNIFTIVENCLKYQFNNAWIQVFTLLGVLFEVIGKDGENYMGSALRSLGNLRQSHNFLYISQLDYTVGKAIRSLGPEFVLKSIPIIITGEETNYEFETSWLLPVLKDNIQSSSLKFFIDYFLPMISICEKKANLLNASNQKIGAHSYDLLQLQIWSLLPAFCNSSVDIKENFRLIARTIGNLIAEKKHIRIHGMAALRKLITKNQILNNSENLEELSKYSKNYLPILFNLYLTKPIGTDESGERLAAHETMSMYLSITNAEQCGDLFDRTLKRLKETDKEDEFTIESLMDLIKLLIPYQNVERLNIIFEASLKVLRKAKSKKEEKKNFRVLEAILRSKSENCQKFIAEKRKTILSFLIKSTKNSKVLNRGVRLRCIFYAVKILPKNHFNAIKALIPEAIVCCKDINKKTRMFAYRLLEEMFYVYRTWTSKSNEEAIRNYISIMVGGLAGTPTLVSATVSAIAKMTSIFKTEMPSDVIETTLQSICLLSSLPEREIVGSVLDYIKIFLTSFHKDQVLPFVPSLVNAVVSMKDDCKNHFRLKTRDVLDRFIRKFSYDVIRTLVPAEDVLLQRRLKNLKRINAKKKASRSDKGDDDDIEFKDESTTKAQPKSIEEILASSDESDEDVEGDTQPKQRKTKSDLFIQEDADNIVDFTSHTASSNITGSIPVKKTEKKFKKEHDFKFTEDGRMIVLDEIDGKDNLEEDSDFDDEDLSDVEGLSNKLGNFLIGRKRKLSSSSEVPAKYQAGGSGIHRPIQKEANMEDRKALRKKKKKNSKNDIPNLKTGKEYRARKAKGDIKLKGKPDPYAYIPLSRKLLNRRQKVNNIVKSAIKGAKIGAKLKKKRKR